MTSRLFCAHCNKHYKVDMANVNLIKKYKQENISFSNNTYYYENGCFFKDVNSLKSKFKTIGE